MFLLGRWQTVRAIRIGRVIRRSRDRVELGRSYTDQVARGEREIRRPRSQIESPKRGTRVLVPSLLLQRYLEVTQGVFELGATSHRRWNELWNDSRCCVTCYTGPFIGALEGTA